MLFCKMRVSAHIVGIFGFALILSSFLGVTFAQSEWQLVFADEFNGNSLDLSKWEYQSGCGETYGSGNHQCYVAGRNNVEVRGGKLVITTKIQNGNGKMFTSGRIRQRSNGIRYGRFVIRARLPIGKLLWPAIWLKAKDKSCYSEVDIMEAKGQDPSRTTFTAHLGLDGHNLVKHGTGARTQAGVGFHEFELIWTPASLQWLVDGQLHFSQSLDPENWWEPGKATCNRLPFSQPMSLILNTAVGGGQFVDNRITAQDAHSGWAKNTFEIEYVRIYQMS